MSKRDRHDSDRRGERRDSQPDEEQQRRSGEVEIQEGDSLSALKVILSKVAALLNPLQLTQEESIRLVEQLYGSVLETDVKLAGEADDTRKHSVLAHIQNTNITRENGKIVVQYPSGREAAAETAPPEPATTAPVEQSTTATPEPPAAKAPEPPVTAPAKPRAAAASRSASPRASARPAQARGSQPAATIPSAEPPAEAPPTEAPAEAPPAEVPSSGTPAAD